MRKPYHIVWHNNEAKPDLNNHELFEDYQNHKISPKF